MVCLQVKRRLNLKCLLVLIIVTALFIAVLIWKQHRSFRIVSGTYRISEKKVLPVHNATETRQKATATLPSLMNIFNIHLESSELNEFAMQQKCVKFLTPGESTLICVYPTPIDKHVSWNLSRSGMWETHMVKQMEQALKMYPRMAVLDLGCNIGVFTIYAAKLGRRVVGVDANKNNLAMLSRSLELNKLKQNVTLIWNAISDVHERMGFRVHPGNTDAFSVHSANKNEVSGNKTVQAITLRDISSLFINTPLFIKMDIEASELKALKQASVLFRTADVRYVMMEMELTRKTPAGKEIFTIMSEFGFKPFPIGHTNFNHILNGCNIKKWPGDVVWIKHRCASLTGTYG